MSKSKRHRTDIPLVPKLVPDTTEMVDVYSRERAPITVSLNIFTEQGGLEHKRELILYPQGNTVPRDLWEEARTRRTIRERLDRGTLHVGHIKPDPNLQTIKREIWVNEQNRRAERVLLTE